MRLYRNLAINEYYKAEESKKEYSNFLDDILMQIIKAEPKEKANFELRQYLLRNLIFDIKVIGKNCKFLRGIVDFCR